MYYTKVRILKSLFSFTHPLLNREKTLIGHLSCSVSKLPSNLCMLIFLIFNFFCKLAFDQKYCLLVVDIFNSKTYTYPMKSWHLLAQKNRTFLLRYSAEKAAGCKKLVSLRVLGGKAYAAEQKIREFNKFLFKSKKVQKASTTSRFIPKKMIRKATANMNNIQSKKYGYTPVTIGEKAIITEKLRVVYDFQFELRPRHYTLEY